MNTKVLAIDTSTDYLSIALLEGERVMARFHEKAEMAHSRLLVPTIRDILKKAKLRLEDMDAFAISIGPGSFTGLRIGATTVKGLSYAMNRPIVAVPTFDVIARNYKARDGIICVVLDAKKNKVYSCVYSVKKGRVKRLSGYMLVPAADLVKIIGKYGKINYAGDGPRLLDKEAMEGIDWHPRADIAGNLALELYNRNKVTAPEDLEPLYIYSKECDITGK